MIPKLKTETTLDVARFVSLFLISVAFALGSAGKSWVSLLFIPAILATAIISNKHPVFERHYNYYLIFCLGYTLISYQWLIKLSLHSASLDYLALLLFILLLIALTQSAIAWGIYSIINQRFSKFCLIRGLECILVAILTVNYSAGIIFSDWFIDNNILEQDFWQKLIPGTIYLLGAASGQFIIMLLIINFCYGLVARNIRAMLVILISAICLIAILETIGSRNTNKDKLSVALIPAPKKPLTTEAQWQHFDSFLSTQNLSQKLLLMPESAYNGLLEYTDIIPDILNQKLVAGQSLILGSDRRSFFEDSWAIYNGAYLLTKGEAYYQISTKKYLTPAGEYIPLPISLISDKLITYRQPIYQRGELQIFNLDELKIAVGLCLEGIVSGWYKQVINQDIDLYVILAREYMIPPDITAVLNQKLGLKMTEIGKSWLKSSAGGLNIIASDGNVIKSDNGLLSAEVQIIRPVKIAGSYNFMWFVALILSIFSQKYLNGGKRLIKTMTTHRGDI